MSSGDERLNWYRQRLTHPPINQLQPNFSLGMGPSNRFDAHPVLSPSGLPCQYPSGTNPDDLPSSLMNSSMGTSYASLSEPNLFSCRYAASVIMNQNSDAKYSTDSTHDNVTHYQNTKTLSSSINSKNKAKMPPLDISEVIETLSSLKSSGKMKNNETEGAPENSTGIHFLFCNTVILCFALFSFQWAAKYLSQDVQKT